MVTFQVLLIRLYECNSDIGLRAEGGIVETLSCRLHRAKETRQHPNLEVVHIVLLALAKEDHKTRTFM